MTQTNCPTCSWLDRLEKERYSVEYRASVSETSREVIKTVIKVKEISPDSKKARHARDRIMFHAGRYIAGVRDDESTDGFKRMTELLGSEGVKL